ncbi:MAG: hypothetical protein ACON4U_02190 [Myxococcota bacterium]
MSEQNTDSIESDSELEGDICSMKQVCHELKKTQNHKVNVAGSSTKNVNRIVMEYVNSSYLDVEELKRVSRLSDEFGYESYVGVSQWGCHNNVNNVNNEQTTSNEGGECNNKFFFKITLLNKDITHCVKSAKQKDEVIKHSYKETKAYQASTPSTPSTSPTSPTSPTSSTSSTSSTKKRPFIESLISMISKRQQTSTQDCSTNKPYLKSLQDSGMLMPPSVSACAQIMVDCISNITDARGHNITLRKSVDVRLVSDRVVLSVKACLPGTIGVRLQSVLSAYMSADKLIDTYTKSKVAIDNNNNTTAHSVDVKRQIECAIAMTTAEYEEGNTSTLNTAYTPCEFDLVLTIGLANTQNEFCL